MTRTILARGIGWTIIALLWVTAGYLLIHYSVLLWFGAEGLHAALGDNLYDALIPFGGFNLLLLVALSALVWGAPFLIATLLTAGILRALQPRRTLRRRLEIAAVLGFVLTASLPPVLLDGWPGPLIWLVFSDDTQYAPNYSALGFWSVRRGMSQSDVLARAGEPLERYPINGRRGDEGWRWTRSPHDSNYRVRAIVFRHGTVVEKYSEVYLD